MSVLHKFRRNTALLVCSIVFVLSGCGDGNTPASADTKAGAPTLEAPPVAPFDAHLTLVNNGGRIDYLGVVDAAPNRQRIADALDRQFGGGGVSGEVRTEKAARPPRWLNALPGLLPELARAPGASLRLEGDRIVLTGSPTAEMRERLRAAALDAWPGARLEGLFAQAPAPLPAAATGSPAKLAENLQALPLRFEDGSGNVDAASLATVVQAAEAIKRAPKGTRLMIVGPVASTGDDAHDLFLSKQRAEALKVQLILNGVDPSSIQTLGWGQNPDGTPIEGAKPPVQGAPMRFELVY